MADALFIGAHPDDVDIIAGGTVAKLARAGYDVVVADATRGEMGSRGTVEERDAESAAAAEVLGVRRINLNLPDSAIAHHMEDAVRAVVTAVREHRPKFVFTHEPGDHHPDHNAIAEAAKYAWFKSNMVKYDTGQERFQPGRLIYFIGARNRWPGEPSFVVDVTETFETKLEAMRCYKSQLLNKDYKGPETYISSEAAWKYIEARAAFFGGLVKVPYGEAFISEHPLLLDDPLMLPLL